MKTKTTRLRCAICDRSAGCTLDRCGDEDGIPLGPLSMCDCCGLIVCPDCLHEADCCFRKRWRYAGGVAPPGWEIDPTPDRYGGVSYRGTK